MNNSANISQLQEFLPGEGDREYTPDVDDIRQGAADTAADLYNIDPASSSKDKIAERIVVHNLSTGPLKWRLNNAATADSFRDIMAGGTALDDGTGGSYVFFPRRDNIKRISALCVGAVLRVSVDKTIPVKFI